MIPMIFHFMVRGLVFGMKGGVMVSELSHFFLPVSTLYSGESSPWYFSSENNVCHFPSFNSTPKNSLWTCYFVPVSASQNPTLVIINAVLKAGLLIVIQGNYDLNLIWFILQILKMLSSLQIFKKNQRILQVNCLLQLTEPVFVFQKKITTAGHVWSWFRVWY